MVSTISTTHDLHYCKCTVGYYQFSQYYVKCVLTCDKYAAADPNGVCQCVKNTIRPVPTVYTNFGVEDECVCPPNSTMDSTTSLCKCNQYYYQIQLNPLVCSSLLCPVNAYASPSLTTADYPVCDCQTNYVKLN